MLFIRIESKELDDLLHLPVERRFQYVLGDDGVQGVPQLMAHTCVDHGQELDFCQPHVIEHVDGHVHELEHYRGLSIVLVLGQFDLDVGLLPVFSVGATNNHELLVLHKNFAFIYNFKDAVLLLLIAFEGKHLVFVEATQELFLLLVRRALLGAEEFLPQSFAGTELLIVGFLSDPGLLQLVTETNEKAVVGVLALVSFENDDWLLDIFKNVLELVFAALNFLNLVENILLGLFDNIHPNCIQHYYEPKFASELDDIFQI